MVIMRNNIRGSNTMVVCLVLIVVCTGLMPSAISWGPFGMQELNITSTSFQSHHHVEQYVQEMERNSLSSSGGGGGGACHEQMYGFVPCSETAAGHVFLIVVYEFLLFKGESFVASGGERIFKIMGPGVFGATAFQVIGSLPEALILLASGLMSNEEGAQESVVTGVGLLAGSTTLLLTLIWGTCVVLSSQRFSTPNTNDASSKPNRLDRFFYSLWPGHGALTDLGTSYTARIMFLSVLPLVMIQVPTTFGLPSSGERLCVLITLVVCFIFLISYFFYQFFQPWIQRRQLLYIKHEHLVVDILKHLQNKASGTLLKDDGAPNLSTIKKLFEERDHDKDKFISSNELKNFLKEVNFRRTQSNKEETAEEIMNDFDMDDNDKITMNEFVNGMTKWLDGAKDAMNKRLHSVNSMKEMYQVLKPWIQKKREEREMMKRLIPDILEHFHNCGSLLADDGTPDVPALKRLFNDIDIDKDNCLTITELKELVANISSGMVPYDEDVAANKIMEELDVSGDQLISEEEFVEGLSKWLCTVNNPNYDSDEESEEATFERSWEQTDKLIEDKFIDKSLFAWMKAIGLLVLGILMLGFLAEPLIHSVREFSTAANLPSFYVSFVFVPLATTARLSVSAITEARKKKLQTTSLMFSEIYGTVFMNNVLGLAVLLSLIYFRDLTWNFAIEVLMVLVVSAVIGCLASFTTVLSVWTAVFAYLLYPLSLVIVYAFGEFNRLSYNVERVFSI